MARWKRRMSGRATRDDEAQGLVGLVLRGFTSRGLRAMGTWRRLRACSRSRSYFVVRRRLAPGSNERCGSPKVRDANPAVRRTTSHWFGG